MVSDHIGDGADWHHPRLSPARSPSPRPLPASTSGRHGSHWRGVPDARPGRQHAPGRPDRLPLDPHVGADVPGRDAVRRLHDRRRPGLEPVAHHDGRGVVRRRMVTLAEVKLAVGYEPDSGQEIRFADGTTGVMKIRDVAASVPAWRARERIKAETFRSAWLGAKVGGGIIGLFLAWFWYRGVQLGRRRRIRGAELVTAGELRRRVRPAHLRALDRLPGGGRLRPYSIAGIPYPERTETQHTIVSGTTGSGKTVLISDLVAQIRARGRALRHLRTDGELHPCLLRPRSRRADEPARRQGAALVALSRSAQPPRFRHDGRGPHSAAEGHGRSVLGDGGAPAVLQRRRGVLEEGSDGKPHPGRPSPQDRPDGARRGDGGHGRAVDRRSRQSQDGALGPRHAHGQPLGPGVPARYRQTLLDPGVDIERRRRSGRRKLTVPDLARRSACEPARPDLDLAGDRGQRDADARPGRRAAASG